MARKRQKAEHPSARLIGELGHLRRELRETLVAYGGRLEGGIERLACTLKEPPKVRQQKKGVLPKVNPTALRDIKKMLTLVKDFTIKPQKGRGKDLRRVEHLVSTLLRRVEGW